MKFFGLLFALLTASNPIQVAATALTHSSLNYEHETIGKILQKVGLPEYCVTCGCDTCTCDRSCQECIERKALAALITEKTEEKKRIAQEQELMRIAALDINKINQLNKDEQVDGLTGE